MKDSSSQQIFNSSGDAENNEQMEEEIKLSFFFITPQFVNDALEQ